MSARIFISYRREDAAGDAGRLADFLGRRFGPTSVFLDIETIQPGADFVEVLQTSLQETVAVLVVIGPRWASVRSADGARRLDDPHDFVRLEVEKSLSRGVPVIPVLVEGAAMPAAADLPPALAPLATRQAVTLDHAEFHADAERLCTRLASLVGDNTDATPPARRLRWLLLAVATTAAIAVGFAMVRMRDAPDTAAHPDPAAVKALLEEAGAQERRNQSLQALDTLARARAIAPDSADVRQRQEDLAMNWIRNVRVEQGTSSFGDAIKPAVAVIDAALPAASGARRADLLAHSGWAAFLMWRDGDRRLNPADWYRDALALDPQNPYANAMLAHWTLFQGDNVTRAAQLFQTAEQSGRAFEAVRTLEWSAYGNASTPAADLERLRLADAMRRRGETLDARQVQALYSPFYFASSSRREDARERLLKALPPDEYIKTLEWAFADATASDDSRRRLIDVYIALLHARAGRVPEAITRLTALDRQLARSPGSLQDLIKESLAEVRAASTGR